ncbi:MAG: hypothetical protein COC06_08300 [Bacteroidales bacterium]|nr:MAG: hypothetical protein COC06_08300 [Bacteroidales bacterium]
MILLASNAVFNLHVHKQSNGALIIHAHPYQKSGNTDGTANHHHSSHECFSLHQITSFLFSLASVFYLAALIGKSFDLNNLYHVIVKGGILNTLLPKRAPPAFL